MHARLRLHVHSSLALSFACVPLKLAHLVRKESIFLLRYSVTYVEIGVRKLGTDVGRWLGINPIIASEAIE